MFENNNIVLDEVEIINSWIFFILNALFALVFLLLFYKYKFISIIIKNNI